MKIKTTYVSGFKTTKIKKKFPNLNIIQNKKWNKTGPIFSLDKVQLKEDEDIIIIYSDILVRYETFKNLVQTRKNFACVVDSNYKKRYKYRDKTNLYSKEKIFFKDNKNYYFSNKNYSKKSAELVGLIKIDHSKIKYLRKILAKINTKSNNYKVYYLLEKIRKKHFIEIIDIKGDWAEINESNDISKFILGTKSETLNRLKSIINKGTILDQFKFNVLQWNRNKSTVISNITTKFKSKPLIVRSSALDEDGDNISNEQILMFKS